MQGCAEGLVMRVVVKSTIDLNSIAARTVQLAGVKAEQWQVLGG
jgi:hypothetical protein